MCTRFIKKGVEMQWAGGILLKIELKTERSLKPKNIDGDKQKKKIDNSLQN